MQWLFPELIDIGLNVYFSVSLLQVWFQNRRSKERRMKQLSALGARRHFFRNPRRMRALRPGELDDNPEMMGQPGFYNFSGRKTSANFFIFLMREITGLCHLSGRKIPGFSNFSCRKVPAFYKFLGRKVSGFPKVSGRKMSAFYTSQVGKYQPSIPLR